MATLTIRIPDNTHARLRQLARHRKISLNKLVEELSTATLAQFDAEVRFQVRARRGSPAKGLRLLDKLEPSSRKTKPKR